MIPDLQSNARQVVIDFLQSHPAPDAYFWSVRDISKKYGYSEYTAYCIRKILTDNGYLEQTPRHRAILKKHVNLSLLGRSLGPLQPAFIWPHWKTEDPGNFAREFAVEIESTCNNACLPHLFLDAPKTWGDPTLILQLKAFSANAVMVLDAPHMALILFTKLRADNIPVVVFGVPREGYDELGVVTMGGGDQEALHLLMLKLKTLGVKTPFMVGYGKLGYPQYERLTGLREAYPNLAEEGSSENHADSGGLYAEIRRIEGKLRAPDAPDALIFNDSAGLELALEMIPSLAEGARQKRYYLAVFDDTGLCRRLASHVPIISIRISAKAAAKKAFELLTNLRNEVRIPKRTLVRREVYWPAGF